MDKIKSKIDKEFPKAKIIGYKSPPFLGLNEIKDNEIIKRDIEIINKQKPDIIWISIGGLKQDLLMYHYKKYLENGLMFGVGAVFDCFVGNIKLRPPWMKRMGLSWLYYLIQQPKFRILKLIKLFHSLSLVFLIKRNKFK